MAKEILLYWGISDWTVESLISQIEEAKTKEIHLRVNSPGGSVFSAYGLFAKIKEHGNVTVKVDGIAASAAALLLMYAKEVESLDVSSFMMHRASMDGSDKNLTPEQKQLLDTKNAEMRKQLEHKVTPEVFKSVTGHSIEDMFSMDTRLNIWLSAEQMKKLGIVGKINKLTPDIEQKLAAYSGDWAKQIAASYDGAPKPESKPDNIMDYNKLKTEHPALFNQILAEGQALGITDGIKAERDRVGSFMAFMDIDSKRAKEGIAKGESLTATETAEFQVAAMSPEYLKKLKADSAKPVNPQGKKEGEDAGEGEKAEVSAFEKSVRAKAGLKEPVKA